LGENLVKAFADILTDFSIEDKVSGPRYHLAHIRLRSPQILSITTDNASANNVMISELAKVLTNFPGQANQMHCFTHIINLIAKSLMKLFEVKKKSQYDVLTDAEHNLQRLVDDIDTEDLETQIKTYQGHVVGTEEMDNDDDILDEIGEMDDFEAAKFQDEILPIRLTLVKVRNIDRLQRSKYSLSSCSCKKYPLKW